MLLPSSEHDATAIRGVPLVGSPSRPLANSSPWITFPGRDPSLQLVLFRPGKGAPFSCPGIGDGCHKMS